MIRNADLIQVHVLIHDLTACILPKIDNFIDQVRIVLADIVGYSESSFDPVVAKKLCSTKKSELSEDLSEQLEMLLMVSLRLLVEFVCNRM